MPPKSATKSKKKKKAPPPPPVAKPEPPVADELEAHMMWEKVAGVTNNSFAPPTFPALYLTASKAIDFGPATGRPSAPHPPPITRTARGPRVLQGEPLPRATAHFLASEHASLVAAATLDFETKCADDMTSAVTWERETLQNEKKSLEEERHSLATALATQSELHRKSFLELSQDHNTSVKKVEEDIRRLMETRDEVVAALTDQQTTLDQTREAETQLRALVSGHVAAVGTRSAILREEKRQLEQSMRTKLSDTVDEMQKLAETQGRARRQRSQTEHARLTAELSRLEAQSRVLNAHSSRLNSLADDHRRTYALESERRDILLQNNAALSRDIHDLVKSLQQLEASFTNQASEGGENDSSTTARNDGKALTHVVDSQYEVIVRLKSDLDGLREELRQVEAETQHRQALLIAAPSQQTATAAQSSRPRAAILDAVAEVDSALRKSAASSSQGLDDVTQPAELHQILNFVVRRVNASSFAPHASLSIAA